MEPVTLPPSLSGKVDCLLIDNFDSFTWNLYQQLCLLGATVTVIRNDAIQASAIPQLNINSLVISPGPGHPKFDSGISRDTISYFAGKVPILGVCMGLECLVDVYGGEIGYAGEIKHGKLSRIRHDGRGCFNGLPQGFKSTRYHSLSASLSTIPDELMVTSATEESGVIMGVRHRKFTVEAVQYHPESILSEAGDDLLRNFLSLRGGTWDLNPQSLILDGSLPSFPTEALTPELQSNGTTPSKMTSILEKICTQRLKDVQVLKSTAGTTPSELDAYLALHLAPPVTPLIPRLKSTVPALMAEIKRASPSKGPIALTANAPQLALTYALSGAAVISVLTEPTWFKGSLSDMRLVRQAIDTLKDRPAVLRKDFILEEYQIAEARLHGADTVLLIVAILPPARLRALYMYSLSLGMEPLVEVNNAREMDQALELGAKVIGVNNRNLHNFEVDLNTTSRLVDMVRGRDVVLCALSGIATPQDVQGYRSQGVDAFLIGEALMKAKDTPALIRDLFDYPEPTQAPLKPRPLVKICGIKTVQVAVSAAEAGVDMLGLVFAPSSKRLVPLDDARQISSAVRSLRSQTTSPPFPHPGDCKSWFSSHASRLLRTTSRPLLIGVFQSQPLETILDIVAEVQLDMVQLHGSEPLEWASRIPVPVIRAFHVNDHGGGLEGVTRPGYHQFILLDAARSNADLSGGAGKVFDWALARHIVMRGEFTSQPVSTLTSTSAAKGSDTWNDQVESKGHLPIFLAGGLDPNNVADAVAQVNPLVVDVSSGVEVDGSKDLAKIKEFIHAVRMNP